MVGVALFLFFLLPALGLLLIRATATEPENLGVRAGGLSPCPASPNCVNTSAPDEPHRIEPLRIEGTREEAIRKLKGAIATIPRLKVVAEDSGYLRAEAVTLLFRFVDDVEFLFVDGTPDVQVRSASRVGNSDMGVNRSRVERIRDALEGSR